MYSPQERADYLALFEQSAMSPADFCREMSLSETTFSLWRRQAREGAGCAESVQFAEVQMTAPVKTGDASSVTLQLAREFAIVSNARLRYYAG